MLVIKLARNCWSDQQGGVFFEDLFELFAAKIQRAYPDAWILVVDDGRCCRVLAESDDEEHCIERHVAALAEEAMREWANRAG